MSQQTKLGLQDTHGVTRQISGDLSLQFVPVFHQFWEASSGNCGNPWVSYGFLVDIRFNECD